MNVFVRQAKEAVIEKDMEELRASNPDSPIFKILEQVNLCNADWFARKREERV